MMFKDIVKEFCSVCNVSSNNINDRTRHISLWMARYMIWHYLHVEKKATINSLVKQFGRSRESIYRGIRVFKHEMGYNSQLRDRYQSTVKKIEDVEKTTSPIPD